jgi:DNA-binding response OmpR family regulator
MTARTVLVIDDDPTLLELLTEHLRASGLQALQAQDGPTGLRLAGEARPDLIVLDVMMPGMDGWQVCERLRQSGPLPIIMLTAKGEEFDKLRGFRLGVDDYVTKPFSFAELTARVRAVLARSQPGEDGRRTTASGDLVIDLEQRRVSRAGQAVELTPTEYRLLAALASRPHYTIPTEQVLLEVWGDGYVGEVEHVKHYIWTLRKKLEVDPGDPKHILTERGFGYRFE